jgi:hypothetical protein
MLLRKFNRNWSYAIDELFIVIAAVPIALAIDQWIEQRRDQFAGTASSSNCTAVGSATRHAGAPL